MAFFHLLWSICTFWAGSTVKSFHVLFFSNLLLSSLSCPCLLCGRRWLRTPGWLSRAIGWPSKANTCVRTYSPPLFTFAFRCLTTVRLKFVERTPHTYKQFSLCSVLSLQSPALIVGTWAKAHTHKLESGTHIQEIVPHTDKHSPSFKKKQEPDK